jgi:hypothetical protein
MKCCGKVLSLEVRSGAGFGHADAADTHDLVAHQFITIISFLMRNGDSRFRVSSFLPQREAWRDSRLNRLGEMVH